MPIIVVMPSDRILRTALATLLVLGAVACGGSSGATSDPAGSSPARVSATATPQLPSDPRELPDFTPDQFDAMLADVSAGTPVVVNFYGSWCGPCKQEAPLFAAASKKYADSVQFIGVDILDTKDAARRFLDTYGITYPSVFDPSATGDIRTSFGFIGQPATLFINYGGSEASRWEGEIDAERLDRMIRPLLPSA